MPTVYSGVGGGGGRPGVNVSLVWMAPPDVFLSLFLLLGALEERMRRGVNSYLPSSLVAALMFCCACLFL